MDGVALPVWRSRHIVFRYFEIHIVAGGKMETVARSAFYQLQQGFQLFLDGDKLATVIHTFIIFRLDYCSALCVGLPLSLASWQLAAACWIRPSKNYLFGLADSCRTVSWQRELWWLSCWNLGSHLWSAIWDDCNALRSYLGVRAIELSDVYFWLQRFI